MKKVELTIDGTKVSAMPGETILSVVRRQGWAERVPTLCFEPDLPPYTSCFVCVVEQAGVEKLLPACSTAAVDGMVIQTSSPRVEAARKTAMELLLSNHPADCAAPCRREGGCPAGIEIQTYLWQAEAGHHLEAVKTIRLRNPLPIVCGRVCVRRCEDVCRRGILDDPVGINMVKRMAADHWMEEPYPEQAGAETGRKVAIVGGGPAGITAAYYLRLAGHAVTIFEMRDKLGGMLRWGIPDYRLPQDKLDWEIQQILDLGVEVRLNARIGTEIPFEKLQRDFDAVFVAVGAQLASAARIKGEEHPCVVSGLDFLIDVKLGKAGEFGIEGKKVAVVGGGNTAIDAARTALRLGARHVSIVYRRTRKEMPANVEEIEAADAEGIRLEFLIAPVSVQENGEAIDGIICRKMELGEPDASGRRRPVPVEGSEHLVACDIVIGAIGQQVDMSGIAGEGKGLEVTRWGTPVADEYSMATTVPGVFTGGDCFTGPAVAIDAIAHGRRAALSICQYLEVGKPARIVETFSSRKENFGEVVAADLPDMPAVARAHHPALPPEEAGKTFDESELTLDDHDAQREAARCLSCGCAARDDCELRELGERYCLDDKVRGQTVKAKVDRSHPHIVLDPNKCILCTRCVRTCNDVLGIGVLGLVNRGFETVMAPTLGRALADTDCVSCGNCVESCPTGALAFKHLAQTAKRRELTRSACTLCGELCAIDVGHNEFGYSVQSIVKDNGGKEPICETGRFDNVTLLEGDRIRRPMVRKGANLVEVPWEEALAVAAGGLKRAAANGGVLVSGGNISCEEAGMLAFAGKSGLGAATGSLTAVARECGLYALDSALGLTRSTAGEAELVNAGCLLVVGGDPLELNPVAAARVRRAVRNGATLISAAPAGSGLKRLANVRAEIKQGSAQVLAGWLLNKLGAADGHDVSAFNDAGLETECGIEVATAQAVLEAIRQTAGSLVVLFVPGSDSKGAVQAMGYLNALVGAAQKGQGSGLYLARILANADGLRAAGLLPSTGEEFDRFAAAARNGTMAAWVVKEDPVADGLLANAGFLVVHDVTMTATSRRADVVLPATTNLETGGTFVGTHRKIFHTVAAAPAVPAYVTLDTIRMLARRIGADTESVTRPEPLARILEEKPLRYE